MLELCGSSVKFIASYLVIVLQLYDSLAHFMHC